MKILGFVSLALGIAILLFGINSTQSLPEKAVEGVTGRYTKNTMWYILGGVALIVLGGGLVLYAPRVE